MSVVEWEPYPYPYVLHTAYEFVCIICIYGVLCIICIICILFNNNVCIIQEFSMICIRTLYNNINVNNLAIALTLAHGLKSKKENDAAHAANTPYSDHS